MNKTGKHTHCHLTFEIANFATVAFILGLERSLSSGLFFPYVESTFFLLCLPKFDQIYAKLLKFVLEY